MVDSTNSSVPEEGLIGAQLDDEIAALRSQISSLKAQRSLKIATILSSHATRSTLKRLHNLQQKADLLLLPAQTQIDIPSDTNPLFAASQNQLLHNQQNLYRACGTITSFRIKDPDPNAVDNGDVLGIRIDISTTGKFISPYYIMLNKPFLNSQLLKVYRHTLPPYIPLAALVQRYLPIGKGAVGMCTKKIAGSKRQDLQQFIRSLRREVVAYHNRISVIKNLRKEFKLDEKVSEKGKSREKVIADINAADAEAKQIRIEWVDGRVGRCVVDDGGMVLKCVILGPEGRDRDTERAVLRGWMAGIGERLKEGIY